jgi:putrescine:ornithine antiporter
VELCQKLAEQVKKDLGVSDDVAIQWVAVASRSWVDALRDGKVRLLCGAPVTLAARKDVSFSIPIYQGGVGALTRVDAPAPLTQALMERPTLTGPLWRGTPTQQVLQQQAFAVIAGSPAEKVVASSLTRLQLTARVTPVKDVAEGVQAVVDRKAAVFFADQSILLDAAKRSAAAGDLKVIERRYTVAPAALALKRGDEDARFAVDRGLSRFYATREFRDLYLKWFGKVDDEVAAFFRLSALPE